jgi:hypothetical protein
MKNYGEELVYWYFRLNGFIPMADFVLHGDKVLIGSDCDLVALRYPHVFESVGGQADDWDNELLRALGYDGKRTLVTFVQVKTGEGDGDQVAKIGKYFSDHLDYLAKRIGIWPPDEASSIAKAFQGTALLETEHHLLSKVVVLRSARDRREEPTWIDWPFRKAIHFVMRRMKKYKSPKFKDRMHFPDSIIQFLADLAHTPEHRWPK